MSRRRSPRLTLAPLILIVGLVLLLIVREGFSFPGINVPPIVITPGFAITVAITPVNPIPITGNLGNRTKTSGCIANGNLPDAACTPGAVFPNATQEQICTPGYSQSVRDVTTAEKNQVFAEYGVTERSLGEYEVDHLVSLELGGSNDLANLWPETAEPKPGFHEKDKVEDYLHDQVCSGATSLQQAQAEISTDWMKVYQQMPGK